MMFHEEAMKKPWSFAMMFRHDVGRQALNHVPILEGCSESFKMQATDPEPWESMGFYRRNHPL